VLLSRFLQLRLGLDRAALIGFENLHQRDPRAPRVLFTHDNYLRDHTGEPDGKRDYRGKKVVLLVRHPADVAVSQYFQWRFRMRPRKKEPGPASNRNLLGTHQVHPWRRLTHRQVCSISNQILDG
jgi:hypothetical protein